MVKEVIKKVVPEWAQKYPEFGLFLRWISQNKCRTRTQVKHVLDAQIFACQKSLNKGFEAMRDGTNTRKTRRLAREIKFLKSVKDKFVKYL